MQRLSRLVASLSLALLAATAASRFAQPVIWAEPRHPGDINAPDFSAPANYIVHGVHLNPVLQYYQEIDNFEQAVGKDVGIVMYFRPWDWPTAQNPTGPCDDNFLPRNVDTGAPPMPGASDGRAVLLTWEPLKILGDPGPADYDNILSGQYDTLIEECADELRNWSNKVFLVRLMHEMNLMDSPWWAGHPYNQKADGTGDTEQFKQAWRYIWQKFESAGVTNVQWVWAPNYASSPDVPWNNLHNYYPGDQYVDWVGLSGYNWMAYGGGFQSYTMLFDAVLRDFQCRYAKPIMHAEIGSAPYFEPALSPPNKAAWITDAYQRMQSYPLVRAAVWFNDFAYHNVNHADFRVWTNSDVGYSSTPPPVPPEITQAYASAVADPTFTGDFDAAPVLDPPMTRCPGDALSSNGVLGARPASAMIGQQGSTTTSFTIGALGLSADTTFEVSGCPQHATCEFASSGSATSDNQPAPWSADTLLVTTTSRTPLGPVTLTITGAGTSVAVQLNVVESIQSLHLPLVQR